MRPITSASEGEATDDHVPGVKHKIAKPAGGQKPEDVEDRPNVGTTTPDQYPGHR